MFRKILVPLDSSALAEQALPIALQLAEKMKAELFLLSVVRREPQAITESTGYGIYLPDELQVDIRQQVDIYLNQMLKRYASAQMRIHRLLREGDEAGMIVDTAVAEGVDLIIMTTHGRSGVTRWLMGSVTERVLHQAPCPILVTRDGALPHHIIITLDGSELAETALLPGLALSLALQTDVTLVQVDDGSLPPLPSALLREDLPRSYRPTQYSLYLQSVAERFSHHPMNTAVPIGNPAEGILDFAKSRPNSLIVISSHGRSGLARWVFGSVAEKVFRRADGPVLIIRPPAGRLK